MLLYNMLVHVPSEDPEVYRNTAAAERVDASGAQIEKPRNKIKTIKRIIPAISQRDYCCMYNCTQPSVRIIGSQRMGF